MCGDHNSGSLHGARLGASSMQSVTQPAVKVIQRRGAHDWYVQAQIRRIVTRKEPIAVGVDCEWSGAGDDICDGAYRVRWEAAMGDQRDVREWHFGRVGKASGHGRRADEFGQRLGVIAIERDDEVVHGGRSGARRGRDVGDKAANGGELRIVALGDVDAGFFVQGRDEVQEVH